MYQKIIEDLGEEKKLCLRNKNIGEDDIKSLSKALRHTQITELDLSDNEIGSDGLKYLADVLGDTQITDLNLRNNNLLNDGVIYLAGILNRTKIEVLELTENKIGFDAAECLYDSINDTNVKSLYLDVYYGEDSENYLSQSSFYNFDEYYMELLGSDIGIAGSKYINKCFREVGFQELTFQFYDCREDDIPYLVQAFENIKIGMLYLRQSHFEHQVDYLIEIFENSQIGVLNLSGSALGVRNVRCLAAFLERIKILDLQVNMNIFNDECIKILAPIFKDNDIMNLNLSTNSITAEGAKYLSEILRDSKIVVINFNYCKIGSAGAKALADGLAGSQVTRIHLRRNDIEHEGYQALIGVVENSNLSWIDLMENDLDTQYLESCSLSRSTRSIACEIENAFKGLVSLNNDSSEFEFIVPSKDCDPVIDISQYIFLIDTLISTPKSKVHIFYNVCKDERGFYDLILINKIDEFIHSITSKFNLFFNNKLPDLLIEFTDADYVSFLEQFEKLELRDIVKNMLLHRQLFYVDKNQEILHPHIYKLLNQYNLPLYNNELEPNKKFEIISYFKSHQEIDGAKEIVNLLKSNFL